MASCTWIEARFATFQLTSAPTMMLPLSPSPYWLERRSSPTGLMSVPLIPWLTPDHTVVSHRAAYQRGEN